MLLEVQFYCQRFVILHYKSLFLEFSHGITAFDHGNHVFLFHNQQNKFTIHQYSLSTISNIIATSMIPSNMSNLMSIKLDHNNYFPRKHQLVTILEAYSPIEHIDGSMPQPCQFLIEIQGNPTSTVNREFQT